MYKLMIYFLIFITSYSMDGININEFKKIQKNGSNFTTMNSLNKMGIDIKKSNDEFILTTDIGIYHLQNNKIITPRMSYSYLSSPFVFQGKDYLPLDIILELSGYHLEKKQIIKSIEPKNLNKSPKKIISLSPGITEKIFALGGEDLLVGRTIFAKYPKEVENIDIVGNMFEPNLEIILDKKPDMVIVETHFREKLMTTLNSLGIETTKYQTPADIPEIHRSILDLGILLGRHSEARGLNASLKDKINYTKYLLKGKKTPKVYYVLASGKTDITPGGDTFINSLIELAGGENIAKDKSGWRYSLEELILNDPNIIFGGKRNIDNMLRDENYDLLSAVQNKKYYAVSDDSVFNLPGPRALTEGIYEMVKIFHPESAEELKKQILEKNL